MRGEKKTIKGMGEQQGRKENVAVNQSEQSEARSSFPVPASEARARERK